MSEVQLPSRPRLDDPNGGYLTVQGNVEALAALFTKGLNDGDALLWDSTLGKFVAGPIVSMPVPAIALPGSPADGDYTVYTDSLTAPTYQWLLVFNATTTYWHFLGGVPLYSSSISSGNTDVTLPLEGDYDILADSVAGNSGSSSEGQATLDIECPTSTVLRTIRQYSGATAADERVSLSGRIRKVGAAATNVARANYGHTHNANPESQSITVWPVRVK